MENRMGDKDVLLSELKVLEAPGEFIDCKYNFSDGSVEVYYCKMVDDGRFYASKAAFSPESTDIPTIQAEKIVHHLRQSKNCCLLKDLISEVAR